MIFDSHTFPLSDRLKQNKADFAAESFFIPLHRFKIVVGRKIGYSLGSIREKRSGDAEKIALGEAS